MIRDRSHKYRLAAAPTVTINGLTIQNFPAIGIAIVGGHAGFGNLIDHGHASIAILARRMGWLTKSGDPQKSKVHAVLERLKGTKLVRSERDRLVVTEPGKKAATAKAGGPNEQMNGDALSDRYHEAFAVVHFRVRG